MSGLHIFVSAALPLAAFKGLSRLYTTDFLTVFYNSLFIYYTCPFSSKDLGQIVKIKKKLNQTFTKHKII